MARRLSVVIPVYRRQRELGFAIRSLAEEAHLIDEVVVVDDASPEPIAVDPPPELAGRVRVIRLAANAGSSAARQAGIAAASGELIAFLDSDDAWLPGKLAAQLPLLDGGGDLVAVACGWQDVDLFPPGRQRSRLPVAAESPFLFASGCWFCPGSTVVVPRAAFDRCGPLDTRLRRLEDLDWFLRFGLAGGRLRVADAIGAVIGRSSRQNLSDVTAAIAIVEERFARHPDITPPVVKRLGAWLEIERAKSTLDTTGRHLRAVPAILRSLLAAPRNPFRLRPPFYDLQLAGWWRESGPTIGRDEALRRLGQAGD